MHTGGKRYFFLGQCLIRASIGFLLSWYFFGNDTPKQTHHHDHKETIILPQEKASRDKTAVNETTINQELNNLVEKTVLQDSEHTAAGLDETTAQKKYNELCSVYETICGLTARQGSFGWIDKYLYQALGIALLNTLDERLSTSATLKNTISSLLIYQSKTDARGSAGHTSVKINNHSIPTLREYREVLTHEFGHTVDLGVVRGISSKKHSGFTEFGKVMRSIDDPSIPFYEISWLNESTRKREVGYKDFVSGYAMKNVYEDFSESHNLRINHNLLFQALAENNDTIAKKYAYFQDLYNNERFDDNTDSAQTASTTKRPWDTTRIR